MKKALLFAAATTFSVGSVLAQSKVAAKLELPARLAQSINDGVASKTTGNGDTVIRTNIILSGTGADTLTYYQSDFAAPADSGFMTGYNAAGYKAYAELYRINNAGNADSAVSVIGIYTYLYGRVSASSAKNVIMTAWASGTRTNPIPTRTKLFFSGKPSTILGSQTVPLKSFAITPATGGRINTDTFIYFQTPSTYTSKDFYVGVQLPSYNFSSLGGDTAILISTQDGNRRGSSYGFISGTDTTFLMQNVAQQANGNWQDFYQEHPAGIAFHLFALPIIKIRIPSAVNGIVKNDLTVFGTFPNPTNSGTNYKFALAKGAAVRVELMDVMGRKIRVIHNGLLSAGTHVMNIETSDLASGNYVVTLHTSNGDGMAIQMTVAK